ncbi:MAG: MGMT family protein [bacterium]|nr:MGMT family protein [Candidatus Colousia faecequi]
MGNKTLPIWYSLHKDTLAPDVPCHRVISSDGFLGGYAFGVDKQAELLRSEGIT